MSFIEKVKDLREGVEEANKGLQFWILVNQIEQWGDEKGITSPENAKSQFMKVVEEVGELSADINKVRDPRDSMGDVLVTLILTARCLNIDLLDCLQIVWDIIKHRTGKTVDGAFIKDE